MIKKDKRLIPAFLMIPAITFLITCGKSIKSAQDFNPNHAPVVTNFTVTYTGTDTAYNSSRLYSGMPYQVTVEAYDPEGQQLTYLIESDQGTFGSRTATDSGITCNFYIGAISGGDSVSLNLTVKDTKNAMFTQTFDVGTGKTGPGLTITPPSNTVINPSAKTAMTISCDSRGTYHAYRDNSITNADQTVIGSSVTRYETENTEVKIPILGPSSSETDGIFLANEKNYIWVVFEDGNGLKTVGYINMYVEGTFPAVNSTYPSSGEIGISIIPEVAFVFSKQMDASTITDSTITLSSAGGKVNGTVSYDATTNIASFVPSSTLAYSTVYTAEVSSAVTDYVGNSLQSAVSVSFTTVPYGMLSSPQFIPPGSTYTGTQTVTLSGESGASIVYTVDGSAPEVSQNADGSYAVKNGTVYGGALTVNTDTTVKALTYASSMTSSSVATAKYKIRVSPPVFTFSETDAATKAGTLTITGDPDSLIYYTTDGNDPSAAGISPVTSGQTVTINRNMKVMAVARKTGLTDSVVTSGSYNVKTAKPVFSISAGTTLTTDSTLSLSCESGAVIYYTISYSSAEPADPVITSNVYGWGIPLTGAAGSVMTYTVKAVAKVSGKEISGVSEATYTVNFGSVGNITFSPTGAGNIFTSAQLITVSCSDANAALSVVADDGTASPAAFTGTGIVYVYVNKSMTLNVTATDGNKTASAASCGFTLKASTPALTGTYDYGTSKINYSVTSSGADSIYYTTNGAAPTTSSSKISGSSGTISVTPGTTVMAAGYRSGWNLSDVSSAIHYVVIYNGNGNTGGTAPLDSTLYTSGQTVTAKTNSGSLSLTNYTFGGWNTLASGSGTAYAAGSGTFSMSSSLATSGVVTLYAKWTSTTTITNFVFTRANNPSLPYDCAGTISGSLITLVIPSGVTTTSFIPTIAISGDSVSPASLATQDYTNPVIYTVTGNSTTNAYSVVVSNYRKFIYPNPGQYTLSISTACTVTVKAWGAGGAGTKFTSDTSRGGGGGYSTSTFSASAGDTIYVMVGYGGGKTSFSSGYPALGGIGSIWAGSGGGGSVVALYTSSNSTYTLKCCGGGGGGGGAIDFDAGGGGGTTGGHGSGGSAGSNGAGGVTSSTIKGDDAKLSSTLSFADLGGKGSSSDGAGTGGGGYGGGSARAGGGGYTVGGSMVTGGSGSWMNGPVVANSTEPDYLTGVGVGGEVAGQGGNGLVVVIFNN